MAWFKKARNPSTARGSKASRVPEGLWVKCPGCSQIIYNKDLAANLNVCPKCAHHFRVSAAERLRMLFDGEWTEHDADLVTTDPLTFVDTKPYKARLQASRAASGLKDAVIVASGTIEGIPAIVGSMERFMGILIENYAGAMPVWLAPVQAVVMNISEHQIEYAREVAAALRQAGIRAVADLRNEKISYKIREHSLQKLPYQVVVGDKEVAAQQVAVRTRKGEDLGRMTAEVFISRLKADEAQKGRAA